jgi:glycosyltransferase involved in cell wall biosynthesis
MSKPVNHDTPRIVVGIDASRNRSGGAIRHLVGILGACDPRDHGISRVHVWSYERLLESLPDTPWLVKHSPAELAGSLLQQLWWQRQQLPREVQRAEVDILLNTDAGTVCRARPAVTMSRDMLSYEPREMRRYAFSRMWLRLLALKYVQARSLADADGAVFLTNYAAETIQGFTGALRRVAVIPHGVGAEFRRARAGSTGGTTRCLYVSQADMYKHQWHVVRAIRALRDRGHDVTLLLAGGGEGRPQQLLDEEIRRSDPGSEFVTQRGVIPAGDLPALLAEHDLFVFASSCENMPNTLVEAMASGLPIACADRGPMPEVLRDGGLYFDPEDSGSIAEAIGKLLGDTSLRERLAARAADLAADYSWERCAAETWAFLRATHRDVTGEAGRGA